MKKLFFSVLMMLAIVVPMSCQAGVSSDGYCNGIKLCGKVKIVNHFADIKVKVVEHFPDLKVKRVDHFPDEIGEWKFVEYGEDFTIQFVEHFPDVKIKFVDHFPGLN